MELQRGFSLFRQQYKALLSKNLLLSWRNKSSTILQLFSSLFFILLILVIQKAIESRYATSSSFQDDSDPTPWAAPPILPCEDKFYTKSPCFDFVWSGNDSSRVAKIVKRIRENNPGRPIPESKVKSFNTSHDVDDWLAKYPMRCPGALHFIDRNSSAKIISYGLQTNSTPLSRRGIYEDPTLKFQIPLQLAAEREIARELLGDPNFSWIVSLKEFAHPAFEIFSAVRSAGPTFFLAIAMFCFVFQISSLVMEKELNLRQAMTLMGLYDTAYWLSWLTWESLITFLSSLLTVLFGMMVQFDFFLNNSFAVVFLLFFLFQLNMTTFAFMLSAFIRKSSSANTVGFFIFIVGFVSQLVTTFGFPYSKEYPKSYQTIWSIFPPNLLAAGLNLLSEATATPQDPGVSWKGRTTCSPNDEECIITLNDIYIRLVVTSLFWFILAIYFDNIVPNAHGVRKSAFYFLSPWYWSGKGNHKVEEGSICSCSSSVPAMETILPDDEDVLEEERIVKQQASENHVDSDIAVQIRGLVKVYAGGTKIGCCKCKKTSTYHALKGLWMNFSKDQLFCLLGPNGAGKTTAINCLTGITPVTAGDALIYGNSIRNSTGMSNIRKLIGFCPQETQKLLAQVKLTEAAKMRAGSYSGGMRRRLSVAIALIGEPKLVILDEPTTGMDPVTRRHVWDVIEEAKKGRSIVLTTHSMEEADILSDRIGIMAKGRLRCIGTSLWLKSRFGSGFIANLSFTGDANGTPNRETVTAPHHTAVKQFFKYHLDVLPKEENKFFMTFVIPHEKEKLLKNFFAELQDREKEFGIADIQLGLTTLEEVFLNIVKQAELENAAAEERFALLTLFSGVSLQVPVGARYIGIPGTESTQNPRGVMVEVYWQQDDSGALCLSGYSDEFPIPPRVQLQSDTTPTSQGTMFRRKKKIRGIVIDPSEVTESDLRQSTE